MFITQKCHIFKNKEVLKNNIILSKDLCDVVLTIKFMFKRQEQDSMMTNGMTSNNGFKQDKKSPFSLHFQNG